MKICAFKMQLIATQAGAFKANEKQKVVWTSPIVSLKKSSLSIYGFSEYLYAPLILKVKN